MGQNHNFFYHPKSKFWQLSRKKSGGVLWTPEEKSIKQTLKHLQIFKNVIFFSVPGPVGRFLKGGQKYNSKFQTHHN